MQGNGLPVVRLTWDGFDVAVLGLAHHLTACIDPHQTIAGVYGVPRGGLPLATALSHHLRLPLLAEPEDDMIWVDDIVDTGQTVERSLMLWKPLACVAWVWDPKVMRRVESRLHAPTCLSVEYKTQRHWYVFPWEDHSQCAAQRRKA